MSNLPTKKIYGQRADNCFKNNDFRKAAGYYLRAISNDTTDTQAILRLAETYNLLGDIKKSSDWYTKGIQISDKSIDYEYFLKYALVLNENENFDNAQYWFIVYQNKLYVDLQIGKYKHYTDKVEELFIDSTFHLIFNLKEINGKQSDINPILIQDRLLFSSQRTNSKTETLEGLVNIYKAHYSDTGTIGDVEKVTTTINTILNKGKMCYSVTSDELYFTGKITDKDQDSNQVDQGIFFTASPLAETSNSEITQISIPRFNNNIGHPALNKGNSRLYFTSNAPGGFGGMDLYYSEKINDKWQKPINLGETINSTGDETFPFLYKDSLLFFSSDGHGGLGGKDLFRTDLTKQNLVIENLGHPINSSSDDFSFFLKENSGLGFFASNRKGGKGKDDLYSLNTFQIQILRTLLADITRENIKENDIKIKTGAGKDLIIKPDEHGLFTFKIQTGEHYKLIIEKNNYQEGKVNIGTKASLAILNDIKLDVKQIGKTELQLPGGKEYNIIIGNMGSKSMDLNALADSSGMLVTEDVLSKTIIIKKDDLVSLYFTAEKDTLISENNVAQTYIIADNNAIKLKQSEDIWFDYISESDNELNIIQTTKTQESVPVVPEEIAMTDNIETKDISDEEEIVAEVEEEILEKEIEKPESEIIPESDSLDIETPLSEESKMEPAHTVEDQAEDILAEITESVKPIDEALTDTKTEIIAQEEDSEEPEAEIITESDSLDIETPLIEETTMQPAHTVENQTEVILAEITESEKPIDEALTDTKTKIIAQQEFEEPEPEIITESDSLDIETPLIVETTIQPAHTVEDQAEDILAEITESEKPIDEALTDTKTEIIAQEEDSEEPEAEIILESDSLDIETPLSEETTIEPAHTVEDQTEDILAEITDSEKLKDDAVIDTKTDFIAQEEDSEEPEAEIILESDSLDIETPLSEETIIEPAHTVEDQAKDILAEITESEEPKDEAVISSKTSINDPEETAAIPDQGLSLKEKLITTSKQDIYYRLQVAAARKPIPEKELLRIYNGPNKLKMFKEDDYYKYYINDYPSYFEAKQTLNETDVKGVFIAAYANGKKVSLKEAMTTQYKERMLQNGKHISDSIINMVTVNFELDKFVLRKDEQEYLAKLVINPLKDKGSYYAIINGHTDIQGDNIYNLGLSEQRSEFVRQLIIDHGINPNRVSTLSFGESQVLKSCEIPEGCDDTVHRVNRRVEVILFSPKNP